MQGRSLQQSNGACELTLNNNTLTFAACQSLQPTLTADYNLLYTITTPADEAGPVLHGAIDAVTPGNLSDVTEDASTDVLSGPVLLYEFGACKSAATTVRGCYMLVARAAHVKIKCSHACAVDVRLMLLQQVFP